ncbi:UNVERIFIED_CONTAM: hypothetical protein GTU68_026253 [Idotea baltica]|nr:hypothetical protein [Idotea baltica]
MATRKKKTPSQIIGWREWVGLPDLVVPHVKAKIDTGARSSSLHAFDLSSFRRGGDEWVRFKLHPQQRDTKQTIETKAKVLEYRKVRSSNGHSSMRPVILTTLSWNTITWKIELTLSGRDEMGFRMLLGREAVRGRYVVDAGGSWYGGKPTAIRKTKKKTKSRKKKPGAKLAILSRSSGCYSTRRLRESAESRGHDVKVLNTLRFAIDVAQGQPDLYFRSKLLTPYDAVLPRIGTSITYFGTAVVRQFEQMDVFCANSSAGISNSRDKLRSLQILSRHHLGIPETTFVRDRKDILPAIERVGGAPVIIKLLEGTQGVGVILADSVKVAEAIIETLHSTKQNVLVQRFVAESKGRDIRAFVVGDRVVAAMRRVAQGTEFRSNVHRGGHTEPVQLDETYSETAIRAAQILGLRVAGVDMLEGADGPQIMEVNSSPGLEGIESCTKLDIAGAIIDYIAAQVDFPEVDIRQRLTVSRGFGVAELIIPEGSKYVGKAITDSGLMESEINVLTLYRGTSVIPNPRAKRVLEAGDRLLCFGRLDSMRGMTPEKIRKRRKPRVKSLPRDPEAG